MGKTQEDMVLEFLKEHGEGMTSREAFERFGIMQMPRRIWNLRRAGWRIASAPETGVNRFGKSVTFFRYTLEA